MCCHFTNQFIFTHHIYVELGCDEICFWAYKASHGCGTASKASKSCMLSFYIKIYFYPSYICGIRVGWNMNVEHVKQVTGAVQLHEPLSPACCHFTYKFIFTHHIYVVLRWDEICFWAYKPSYGCGIASWAFKSCVLSFYI